MESFPSSLNKEYLSTPKNESYKAIFNLVQSIAFNICGADCFITGMFVSVCATGFVWPNFCKHLPVTLTNSIYCGAERMILYTSSDW